MNSGGVWPSLLLGEMQESVQVKKVTAAKKCPICSYTPLAVCNCTENPQLLSAHSSSKQLALVTGTARRYQSAP